VRSEKLELSELEARMREFRPRRPAAIPDERLQRLRGSTWAGVAAGIAAAMLIATWLRTPAPRPVDAVALTTLALENPEAFDTLLMEVSRTSLPDVTAPGGALERLARGF
jgi:hypothetical protein